MDWESFSVGFVLGIVCVIVICCLAGMVIGLLAPPIIPKEFPLDLDDGRIW